MNNKILLSYVYSETPKSLINLRFFLKHGITPTMTVYLCIKGQKCSINSFPDNVVVNHTDNVGFDFRGHKDNLNIVPDFNEFTYFVLMNDGCIGPFYKGEGYWYDIFTTRLNDTVKLVGTTKTRIRGPNSYYGQFNHTVGKPHISCGGWFLCLDIVGVRILSNLYNQHDILTYKDAHALERLNGKQIIDQGYQIDGLFSEPVACNRLRDPYHCVIFKAKYNSRMMSLPVVKRLINLSMRSI